jgi:hypothetical protein
MFQHMSEVKNRALQLKACVTRCFELYNNQDTRPAKAAQKVWVAWLQAQKECLIVEIIEYTIFKLEGKHFQ